MAKRAQKSIPLVDDESRVRKLQEEINKLPETDEKRQCEGRIRELHKTILNLQNEDTKDQLLSELKTVSCRGLSKDLRKEMEDNGLGIEGLDLVLKYLTTKTELAQYLFTSSKEEIEKDGLEVVRRRLGQNLDVLGGLASKGIDVNKQWALKLVKLAPSFQSLARISIKDLTKCCEEASTGEIDVVRGLVKVAESYSRQLPISQEESDTGEKETKGKAIDEGKLEKARALKDQAKEMAAKESKEAQKAVQEKMAEITKILELPPDWYKQDIGTKPDQLFKQLDQIIEQFDNVAEVGEAYKNDCEVVVKASGGRALCGIYFSEYVAPMAAERALIVEPAMVTLASPNNSQQIRYLRFSESRAAANYVQTVKSSSTNIGYGVGGFYGLFVGDVHGSYGSRQEEDRVSSQKKFSNSASVLQYIWIGKKTFKIEQEQMRLSMSARKMAMSIAKADDNIKSEVARRFMKRYGSHFPAGLHTLGGVLFRTVDASSQSDVETYKLTEKATQHLQNQISIGFVGTAFGIGASVTGEYDSSAGETSAQRKEDDTTSYTFSFQSMGPATTNPAMFSKLLANNSTWALIDRGSPHAYIPVWELIRDLGTDYESAATVLEKTWVEDEKQNRKRSVRVEYKVTEIIKNDLVERADQIAEKVLYGFITCCQQYNNTFFKEGTWTGVNFKYPETRFVVEKKRDCLVRG